MMILKMCAWASVRILPSVVTAASLSVVFDSKRGAYRGCALRRERWAALVEKIVERQHAAARAPAAFLDDAEIDPPARRGRLHAERFGQRGKDVAHHGL